MMKPEEARTRAQMYEVKSLDKDRNLILADKVLAKSPYEAVKIAEATSVRLGARFLQVGPMNAVWSILLHRK